MTKQLLWVFTVTTFVSMTVFGIIRDKQYNTQNNTVLTATCTPATATFTVVPDCQNGDQFLVEVDLTDLGSAASVTVSDNFGSAVQTLSSPSTLTFGPYPNGADVIITIADEADPSCELQSNVITQEYCPTDPIVTDVDTYTVEELVQDVLFDTPCANVSNITYSTGVTADASQPNGIGYFTGENSTFPILEGLILSTGEALNAPGPASIASDGGYTWPGDEDITALIQEVEGNPNMESHNASVIEFDFVPYTTQISFNYLFASAEYGTYQCDFTDTFVFLLTDENGNTVNLALIPNTTTPVSVTTIRNGAYNGNCESVNPEYFDKYYGTPNGIPEEGSPIVFRGHTVKMTAQAEVEPGQTYHIKLAVADRSDTSFDSAVFLEAGSFDIGSIDLGADLTIDNQSAPCEATSAVLDAGIEDNEFVEISWYKDGFQIEGATGTTLEVTEPGTYTVFAIYGGSCVIQDDILVEFAPVPQFEFDEVDESICSGGTVTLNGEPLNIADFQGDVIYTWSFNGELIPGATTSTYEATEAGTYTVDVATSIGCAGTHIFQVSDASFSVSLGDSQSFCDQESFQLTPALEGLTPENATYEWVGADGSVQETTPSITVSQTGTYTVLVSNGICTVEASVDLYFNTSPEFNLGEDITTSSLEEEVLDATPSNINAQEANYEWTYNGQSIPENGPTINPADYGYGTYTVTVYGEDAACNTVDSIVIEELPEGVIPEGISPGNNDGVNDTFDLTFLNQRAGIKRFVVYNRYGTKVFEQSNYTNQWYGQDKNGNQLATGTYYYIIELQSQDPKYDQLTKGWVYINQAIN